MNLFEIFNNPRRVINEGIDHPEDLIIQQGAAGADRVIDELSGLSKDSGTVTIKWDGFPAVVFGRDASGQLVFVDKHMFDKIAKGKMEFTTIQDYDISREADRASLWQAEETIRPALDAIVPAVKDQYWMGDLMWTGVPKTVNGYYDFKPNTVEYRIPVDSELGNKIENSVGGIAVHTFIPGLGQGDVPLKGLKGLKDKAGITFLTGEMHEKPKVTVDPKLVNHAKAVVNQYRGAVDKFMSDLTAMKGKMVLTAMSPFITSMLEENDISNEIVPRFLEFLKSRLSPAAAQKFLGANQDGWLFQADGGAMGLLGVWSMWAAVTDLKIHTKQIIDSQQQGSEVIALIDGQTSHEGYVFGSGKDKLKLVDRLGFSRANFAKHKVPDEEIQAKSKTPLAVFCFGRMNPPTLGHKLVMEKTVQMGGKNAFIFLSNSEGKDDPLDPATKAAFISQMYPNFAGHIVKDFVQGPIYAANWLYDRGFRNMAFVAGSDRLGKEKGSIEKLLNSWNSGPVRTTDNARGEQGREHVVIQFVSSGQRDPDSEGIQGYSGTKARQAAEAGNEAQFQQFTGVKSNVVVGGKTLYQATREGLGIKDQQPPQPTPGNNMKLNTFTDQHTTNEDLGAGGEHTGMSPVNGNTQKLDMSGHGRGWNSAMQNPEEYDPDDHPNEKFARLNKLKDKLSGIKSELAKRKVKESMAGVGMEQHARETGQRWKGYAGGESSGMDEAQFNSKQEVIDYFVKNGKSASAGAMAWERGWRGHTPKKKKELRPPVRSYHDDLDDKRYNEAMLPKSDFVGSKKNKLGPAGQLKGNMKRPARQGDLVGGSESIEELSFMGSPCTKDCSGHKAGFNWAKKNSGRLAASTSQSFNNGAAIQQAQKTKKKRVRTPKVAEDQRLDKSCWKGYRKQGTKMKGGTRVNNCVKVGEAWENEIAKAIKLLENK